MARCLSAEILRIGCELREMGILMYKKYDRIVLVACDIAEGGSAIKYKLMLDKDKDVEGKEGWWVDRNKIQIKASGLNIDFLKELVGALEGVETVKNFNEKDAEWKIVEDYFESDMQRVFVIF